MLVFAEWGVAHIAHACRIRDMCPLHLSSPPSPVSSLLRLGSRFWNHVHLQIGRFHRFQNFRITVFVLNSFLSSIPSAQPPLSAMNRIRVSSSIFLFQVLQCLYQVLDPNGQPSLHKPPSGGFPILCSLHLSTLLHPFQKVFHFGSISPMSNCFW